MAGRRPVSAAAPEKVRKMRLIFLHSPKCAKSGPHRSPCTPHPSGNHHRQRHPVLAHLPAITTRRGTPCRCPMVQPPVYVGTSKTSRIRNCPQAQTLQREDPRHREFDTSSVSFSASISGPEQQKKLHTQCVTLCPATDAATAVEATHRVCNSLLPLRIPELYIACVISRPASAAESPSRVRPDFGSSSLIDPAIRSTAPPQMPVGAPLVGALVGALALTLSAPSPANHADAARGTEA